MVTELALFTAQPGKVGALEEGLRAAMAVIRRGEGCRAIRLLHNLENPNVFVYAIEWETLEHHTVGFRGGPLFAEYRAHINGLFVEPVDARHYMLVDG